MIVTTELELEELLSRPNAADREAMANMGDLLILGVNGKMGPSLAMRARRAADEAGVKTRVIGVSRFSSEANRKLLEKSGVETISADVLDDGDLSALPDCPAVISLAARKFGSTGDEPYTWAMNAYAPARIAERFKHSAIATFSSGNVYPLTPVAHGGSTEDSPLEPVGEYAMSAVARERLLSYMSKKNGTPMAILRLNYAVELRYGVLLDIGLKVFKRETVDLRMGNANVIWQGDANSICLRALRFAQSPPLVMNLTGPETISVRQVATRFGELFGCKPGFSGEESPLALLNNAAKCHRTFGYPTLALDDLIDLTGQWICCDGPTLNKPTHFEARDGKF